MPAESSVEYSANSKTSNVNLVYQNECQQNANGNQETQTTSNKGMLPTKFERASPRWWDLRFDSGVLEKQFKISSLPQYKTLFRHSLVFTSVAGIAWGVNFAASVSLLDLRWIGGVVWSLILAILSLILLIMSNRDELYQRYFYHFNAIFLVSIAVTAFTSAYFVSNLLTVVGSFLMISVVILLLYLILPLPVPILCAAAVVASIVFEVILQAGPNYRQDVASLGRDIGSHILLHVCFNVIGCLMVIDLQIIRHSIFLKICRCIQATQAKESEEEFIDYMVRSVMPPSVAEQLLLRDSDVAAKKANVSSNKNKANLIFRPFTMERMDNVSILYADIVGFTRMSSNKSAAELVRLLNDLFGRFDDLCIETKCEKISTLGDCYYCVAGCPTARTDHARCCVKMGLGMVSVIKEFCKVKNIDVNMRVGIHTGYVLCGVVGTRRFKFDVWSNDVTLANGMEQHGIPGRVHISQATLKCLGDEYDVEDSHLEERSEEFMKKTGKTYLVVGPKNKTAESSNNAKTNGSGIQTVNNRLPPSDGQNKEENEAGSNNSTSSLIKRDQLSRMIEQHFNPIFLSGNALVKLRKKENDIRLLQSIGKALEKTDLYDVKEANAFTLQFKAPDREGMYRSRFEEEVRKDSAIEYCTTPRYRLVKDMLLSTFVTLLLFVSSILLLQSRSANVTWIVVFVILFLILFLYSTIGIKRDRVMPPPYVVDRWYLDSKGRLAVFWLRQFGKKDVAFSLAGSLYLKHKSDLSGTSQISLLAFFSTWPLRHFIGAVFLLIPAAVVFSHVDYVTPQPFCSSYLLLFTLVLVHFFNYNQLSTWGRAFLSAVVLTGALLLVYVNQCQGAEDVCVCKDSRVSYEYIMDFILLLLFIFMINRHFELSYRLDFLCENKIKTESETIQAQKDKVVQLVKNFIPDHVRQAMAEHKEQSLYSKTHEKVGVIFGTIVNFNELYEESFEGGKEFLRFLSELISDVDDLLNKEKYKDIEKIKTIGTTFMLASGLNPDVDQELNGPDSHLHRLMDFCIDMQNTVDDFNNDMLNFRLVLRIGFNHGEVTAGVIGSTKKLYDIWGDTVNIASRMDSTGVPNRVQVSEESKKVLENTFNFQYSGEKFVKGKGQMRTYLLVRDDEDQRFITPNPTFDYKPF